MRENQILGYGLVIGLKAPATRLRNSPFTEQSLQSMLDNMGINVRNVRLAHAKRRGCDGYRRLAAVHRPAAAHGRRRFVARRRHLAVGRHAGDDAVERRRRRGLRGRPGRGHGRWLLDRRRGRRLSVKASPTAGRIPNGALVEREVQGTLHEMEFLVLELKNPDFVTATRIIDAINAMPSAYRAESPSSATIGPSCCQRRGSARRSCFLPKSANCRRAGYACTGRGRERTGTVVIGRERPDIDCRGDARQSDGPGDGSPVVSQPAPFSRAPRPWWCRRTAIEANEAGAKSRSSRRGPAAPGPRPEPDRPEAFGHHCDPAGDQDGGRASGRSRHPV